MLTRMRFRDHNERWWEMSNRHPGDPTLTEELLEKVEDARSAPLHLRVERRRHETLGTRAIDPRDDSIYCDDVCIAGPGLIREAVNRLRALEQYCVDADARAKRGQEAAERSEVRVVAERRRADKWEERARRAEKQWPLESQGRVEAEREIAKLTRELETLREEVASCGEVQRLREQLAQANRVVGELTRERKEVVSCGEAQRLRADVKAKLVLEVKEHDESRRQLARAVDTINRLLEAGDTLTEVRDEACQLVEELVG